MFYKEPSFYCHFLLWNPFHRGLTAQNDKKIQNKRKGITQKIKSIHFINIII